MLKTFLTLLFLLSSVLLCAAPTLDSVSIYFHWRDQPQFSGYYMAKSKGFYEKEGLDVALIASPQTNPLQFLKGKKNVFVNHMLFSALQWNERSDSLKLVFQIIPSTSFCIVAWRDPIRPNRSRILHLEDLKGARFSTFQNNLQIPYLYLNRMRQLNMNFFPQYDAPSLFLMKHVEACSVTTYNELNYLYQRGVRAESIVVFPLKNYNANYPEDGLYTSAQLVRENPELVLRVRRATQLGWEYAKTHPEETIRETFRMTTAHGEVVNYAQCEYMYHKIMELVFPPKPQLPLGKISPELFYFTIDCYKKHGILHSTSDYKEFTLPEVRP